MRGETLPVAFSVHSKKKHTHTHTPSKARVRPWFCTETDFSLTHLWLQPKSINLSLCTGPCRKSSLGSVTQAYTSQPQKVFSEVFISFPLNSRRYPASQPCLSMPPLPEIDSNVRSSLLWCKPTPPRPLCHPDHPTARNWCQLPSTGYTAQVSGTGSWQE